jgi:hypothetical protein
MDFSSSALLMLTQMRYSLPCLFLFLYLSIDKCQCMTLLTLSTTHPSLPLLNIFIFVTFAANGNYFSISGKEVEKDVQVGMIVLILAEEILDRSFQRFQWWEKPPPDVISFMANKEGDQHPLTLSLSLSHSLSLSLSLYLSHSLLYSCTH